MESDSSRQVDTARLLGHITALFNEEELKTLCFGLKIEYDSLPAVGKAHKARELVAYAERHHCLNDLLDACRPLRSLIPLG